MKTSTVKKLEPRSVSFPPDLRETLGEQIVLKLALSAVSSLNTATLEAMARNSSTFRPQMMLTLLSYCYASGIYGSEDIANAIWGNRMVRYICARQYPDRQAIRMFRRWNRELVDQCLACVLKKAWLLGSSQSDVDGFGSTWTGSEFDKAIAAAARSKIESAIIMDTAEAE